MPDDAPFLDLVIRASDVLTENGRRPASIAIAEGLIVAVGERDAPWRTTEEIVLPEGQVLIPGIVDTHVHVNEPGRTEWEGFASATRAAAAGGVTTIIDMPLNSIPPTTTVAGLEAKRAAAGPQAQVDVGFWGGAIPSNLGTLRELHDAGVFGFKCFLSPSGVNEFPHLSREQLVEAMREIAAFDGLLIVHAEDPAELEASALEPGASYGAFVDSRPPASERSAILHVIEAVRETGCRAHILHLSSADALPLLREAKAEGLPISAETCPHYLTFDAGSIPDGGTQFKCCPPIRDERNRELLWKGLLDGTIDIIASDHSPATAELKLPAGGDFGVAWGGISGLELSFRAVWTGARERGIPLEQVVAWMSTATAAFAGLGQKGLLHAGSDADLVAFDPEAQWRVDVDALSHRNPVSAYEDRVLRGAVAATWVGGRRVTAETVPPAGRLLTRP
ncbi:MULTISPECIES: allantoinase AllB [unclassified Rathayibacter]|jgi:allantoinase|uniref:allantoinase AllB n=1 Tax=unclassified Rathayibacter TaxID=2609250 RepID=UPI000CE7431C|nr:MULTISPECIES: allantoinase AllB [unclassified Rathayibacter]PPF27106.1 allantoinase AllB [Rathayibacter sp. AY1F2]PPH41634.1 allantoinase AllB [Rathayibacter sp. AY1F7]